MRITVSVQCRQYSALTVIVALPFFRLALKQQAAVALKVCRVVAHAWSYTFHGGIEDRISKIH